MELNVTKPRPEVTSLAQKFLKQWLDKRLPETTTPSNLVHAEACRLSFECLVTADDAGIRRQAIEKAVGDLIRHIKVALEERNAELRGGVAPLGRSAKIAS
ncbi:hypothetical protein GCM10007036_21580 [Alsobacter metallidurans]|uniref:DUF768 domain-containing protein n=1 Tax=Alsobacter metallidurans TaxID=340221 RepID=A0A917I7A4_9HYPH|nr:DUF768 domain-containing protein [Alsobacter metallidurans]GGH19005.1 hypothetical protein GCM10007036_21580 [Alsobacter metallidurans]